MAPISIALIDAGTGNLPSVHKALRSLGAPVTVTANPEQVRTAGKVVLPGVGAFGDFMAGLRQAGLESAILEFVERGGPLLGICVGMQALFEGSDELGQHAGLGLLAGRVQRFPDTPGLKVPHTGWNQLEFVPGEPLWAQLAPGAYAYFNHSFYCAPASPDDVSAWTSYGTRFASAVHKNNLFGVQFHPEKSQQVGLQVLENFVSI